MRAERRGTAFGGDGLQRMVGGVTTASAKVKEVLSSTGRFDDDEGEESDDEEEEEGDEDDEGSTKPICWAISVTACSMSNSRSGLEGARFEGGGPSMLIATFFFGSLVAFPSPPTPFGSGEGGASSSSSSSALETFFERPEDDDEEEDDEEEEEEEDEEEGRMRSRLRRFCVGEGVLSDPIRTLRRFCFLNTKTSSPLPESSPSPSPSSNSLSSVSFERSRGGLPPSSCNKRARSSSLESELTVVFGVSSVLLSFLRETLRFRAFPSYTILRPEPFAPLETGTSESIALS